MVTVLITAYNEAQLNRTIRNLYETAGGDIEVIVSLDAPQEIDDSRVKVIHNDKPVGRRIGFNTAAKQARGKYLFILDAHCKMTPDWDVKMVESCPDNGIVVSCIQDMYEYSWKDRAGIYQHVYLNKGYEEKWWSRKPVETVEELMCFTGCSWLIPKSYYWQCGGYDESLGPYGWDGPEWACKVWMGENPGKVLLRSDVICGHVFGTNEHQKRFKFKKIPYPKYKQYMHNLYKDKIRAFRKKFAPIPDEHDNKTAKREKTETIVNKIDTVCSWQGDALSGLKKIHYKPFKVVHDGTKTDEEIESLVLDLITDIDREEVIIS